MKWLKKAAEQGHAEAQEELGWYYAIVARPRRHDFWLKWWRLSAAQGNDEVANMLGEALRDGWGVRKNRREAVRWFRAAAERGEPTAELNLGCSLFCGHGVRRDMAAALWWYRRAARHGPQRASAAHNIGLMYGAGDAVAQSRRTSIVWLEKAAALGHSDSMLRLARMHRDGEGHPRNERAAIRWLRRAARVEDTRRKRQARIERKYGLRPKFLSDDPHASPRWVGRPTPKSPARR